MGFTRDNLHLFGAFSSTSCHHIGNGVSVRGAHSDGIIVNTQKILGHSWHIIGNVVDSGASEPAVTAQVEPPKPPTSTPGNTQVVETTSEMDTDPAPSRAPMDASLVLESALASMVSAGSNEVLPSGNSLLPRGDDGQPVPAQERHIFICGQCSHGFGSLDECKEHMVEVHDLKVATECDSESKKTTAGRKRGRPRVLSQLSSSTSGTPCSTASGSDVVEGALQSVDVADLGGSCSAAVAAHFARFSAASSTFLVAGDLGGSRRAAMAAPHRCSLSAFPFFFVVSDSSSMECFVDESSANVDGKPTTSTLDSLELLVAESIYAASTVSPWKRELVNWFFLRNERSAQSSAALEGGQPPAQRH
ncbi:hypothetical protein HPB50_003108 [Hyalomma asiaticum]|uniref:Uncharacterized protein n=1 Tax=Hyalomma asiaticum TaxID=266040 RepID=A0ACB7TE87_HYAAI|nr:hypothetical protein HPB50_003108 [Hyalomma asiaticum]